MLEEFRVFCDILVLKNSDNYWQKQMTAEFFRNYLEFRQEKQPHFFSIIIWFEKLIEKIIISLLSGRVQTVAIVLEPRWSE
jgi:hypothetical protein